MRNVRTRTVGHGARKGIIDKLSVFIILAPREAVTGRRMEGGLPGLPTCLKGLTLPLRPGVEYDFTSSLCI